MKRFVSLLIVMMMMAAGCGSRPAASPAPAPAPAPAPPPVAPQVTLVEPVLPEAPKPAWYNFKTEQGVRLLDNDARRRLTWEQLRSGLEQFLNADPPDAAADKLAALREAWWGQLDPNARPHVLPMVESDLDADGRHEIVLAVNSWMSLMPVGGLFVIYERDEAFHVDAGTPPPGEFGANGGFVLLATANLTGHTGTEIVWAALGHGAHTQYAYVFVSRWAPGHFDNLPGRMYTSFPQVQVQGRELLLMGGETGSAGAGMVQRVSTDHYAWDAAKGEFRLTDREYAASEYAYHRLLDGINAESFGHPDKAEAAYRSALEPGREPVPDVLMPEMKPRFGPAMRAFAAFRLRLLLQSQGRTAETVAVEGPFAGLSTLGTCEEAAAWGKANPAFFEVMNALMGYRNITWTPGNLCGALPPDMK